MTSNFKDVSNFPISYRPDSGWQADALTSWTGSTAQRHCGWMLGRPQNMNTEHRDEWRMQCTRSHMKSSESYSASFTHSHIQTWSVWEMSMHHHLILSKSCNFETEVCNPEKPRLNCILENTSISTCAYSACNYHLWINGCMQTIVAAVSC